MATPPPSLDDLLEGVPPEKLDKPCRDRHLCDISLKIADWKSVAPFLRINEVVQREIESEGGIRAQRVAMLRRWKKKYGRKGTYRKLAEVFWKLEMADLVDEICTALAESHSSSSEEEILPPPKLHRNIFCQYAVHLQSKYTKEIPTFTQWPPPPTNKFFNLAIIERHRIQLGPIDEEYVRLTQRGNVDDIMLSKKAILLEDIFRSALQVSHDGSEKRIIVLVEGAPGAGKSTLAWYICEQWGLGNLFAEFKLVVFVQLRSPAIQNATSIADILPRMANGREREVLTQLETRRGKDVLFVLDGWDEYSWGLTQDSICGKLIRWPGDLNMQESTVLITSRPVASGELQQLCSARVEIVGFAQKEVRGYFKQALIEARQDEQAEMLQECLKVRPVIQASCYLPLNAAIVIHLFITEGSALPTTLHGLFTSLVLNCIVRHMHKQEEGTIVPKMICFDNIPTEILPHFNAVCAVAFHGIKRNKAFFSEEDLRSLDISTGTSLPLLSLIQGWSTFKSSWQEKSYSFYHLSVQELLAAFHISKCPASEQVQEIRKLFGQPRFAAVLHYYAAFTKFQVEGIREFLKEVLQQGYSGEGGAKKTSGHGGNVSKSILDSLYEAQDPALCQYVATLMEEKLTVDYTMSPLDCMVLGYFLYCICLTPGGGKFHIDLHAAGLDEYTTTYLISEVKRCSHGRLSLSLSGNGSDDSVAILVSMLQKSCFHCISDLSIHESPQDRSNLLLLTKALSVHNNIPVVSLSVVSNEVIRGREPSTELINVLSSNLTLRSLQLSRVSLGSKFTSTLSNYLSRSVSLKTLVLSNGVLELQGARALANILATNSTLETFDLSHFSIPVEGAAALVKSLATNPAIRTVRFSRCNPPPTAGLLAVFQAVQSPSKVCDLSRHFIPITGAKDLALHLSTDSTMENLILDYCHIPFQGAIVLADSLSRSLALKEVHCLKCEPPKSAGALKVALTLRSNPRTWNLSGCNIPVESAKTLASSLALSSNVEVLDLSSCELPLEGATAVAKVLTINSSLTKLKLSNCLPAESAGTLAVSFAVRNPNSQCDLSGHTIPCKSAQELTRYLQASSKVRVLNLSHSHLSVQGAAALSGALATNPTLKALNLSACSVPPRGAKEIAGCLARNSSIHTLDISESTIASEYTQVLAAQLKKTRPRSSFLTALKNLNLSRCSMQIDDARALAFFLTSNSTLETLILSGCKVPPEGIAEITYSLAVCSTIKSLDLSACTIELKAAKALATLASSSRLEVLNLSQCEIPFKGARVLSDSLSKSSTLKTVDSSKCVPPESEVVLRIGLAKRLGLQTWDLSQQTISLLGAQALGDYLHSNSVVQALNLSSCVIPPEAVSALASSLTGNSSLRELNLQKCTSTAERPKVHDGEMLWSYYGHSARSNLPILHINDFLAITSTLQILNLSGSNISLEGTMALAKALQQKHSILKTLNLSGCTIPLEGAIALSTFLARNRTLTIVKSSDCHPPASNGVLAVALVVRSGVEMWNLSGCSIPLQGAKLLSDSLSLSSVVKKLNLSRITITPDGAQLLASSLARNTYVKSLDLSGCSIVLEIDEDEDLEDLELFPFGDFESDEPPASKRALASLLAINTALETLNLSCCSIPLEGATALAASLRNRRSCLKALNLSPCRMPVDGAVTLAASLDTNYTLKTLQISRCYPRESASILAVSLAVKSEQVVWDLSGHTLHEMAVKTLADSLASDSAAKILDLSKSTLFLEGVRLLANSLTTNKTLKTLDLSHCNIVSQRNAKSCSHISREHTEIQPECVKTLAITLTINSTLQHLSLPFWNVQLEGVIAIADLLRNKNSSLKTLNLTGCQIPSEGAAALADSLVRNSTLEALYILECHPPASAGILAVSLAVRSTLEICDLSGHTIPTKGARVLADSLVSASTVKMLNLSGCTLSPEGAKCLGTSLGKTSSLNSLDISRCSIVREDQTNFHSDRSSLYTTHVSYQYARHSPKCAKIMAALLTLGPNLEMLNLSRCFISPKAVEALAFSLDGNSTLKALNLSKCHISPEGMNRLVVALTRNSALKVWSLPDCECVIPFEKTLTNFIATNSSLETLDLTHCHMTLEGATLLADAIAANTTLKVLHCSKREYKTSGVAGALAVSKALRCTSNLKTWDFSGLTIPLGSTTALATALSSNTFVQTLNISECSMLGEGVRVLASSLVTNSNLKMLNLSGCVISQESASALAGLLASSSSIKALNLSRCVVPAEGMKDVVGALADNSSIIVLKLSGWVMLSEDGQTPVDLVSAYKHLSRDTMVLLIDITRILANSLVLNTTLGALDLSQWVIQFEGAQSLSDSMTSNSTLKELKLSRSEIPPEGISILLSSLARNSTLKALDISGCTVPLQIARELAILLTCSGLESLNVSECNIPVKGARAIAVSVAKNPTLKALYCSQCRPEKSAGILAVSVAVRSSSSTWDLSGCNIPLASAFDLVASLTASSTVETLTLSQCSVAPEGMGALAGALARCSTLKALNLSGCSIHLASVRVMAQSLSSNLKMLDLSHCTIPPGSAKVLAQFLAINSSLDTLNLSGCRIPVKSARAVAASLANNSTLKVLYYSKCKPSNSEGILAVALAIHLNLDTWNLSGLTIPLESAREIASSLEESLAVTTLNLAHCKIPEDGITLITHSVTHSPTLKSVNLSGCALMEEDVKALAYALSKDRLKELNLSDCDSNQESVLCLAKALTVNKSLESLMVPLEYCEHYNLYHLAEALKVNSTLKMLKVYGRKTYCRGLECVLSESQSLQSLMLSNTDLSFHTQYGITGADYLAQGLRKNKSLRSLSIAYCNLTDHTMEMIVVGLEEHALLQELDFSNNKITKEGLCILGERLKKIDSLRKVTSCAQDVCPEY